MPFEHNPSLQVVCAQTVILEKDTNDNAVEVKRDTDDVLVSNEMKDLSVTSVPGNEQAVNKEIPDEDKVIIRNSPDSSILAGEKKDIQDNPADITVKGEDEEDSPKKEKRSKRGGWRYLDDDEEQLGMFRCFA